ncbi:bifunctional folylpolyglutamate synthase/dihydrofolate synthase [Kordiimonas aestuarii]|uniref:bifunctional folylpolyglutamate synthase/dihydrofolate synthase n=1 Tax=Kordiimonas aestuarii TaxID=1005925 RepID=UPI0021D1EC74|nr:folylpolyglutamate synthase/dihydrofolate synthase family protein [Kordiimonas aestuarii]
MDTSASDKVLARLKSLHPVEVDLSLERLYRLLEKLDNPHKKLPPVIHVAGTNGKGSTVATLRAIAEAAGHRVHVYTSPHLVRFAERIRVAGQVIGEEEFTTLLEEVEARNDGDDITFFEVTTAAAFLAFARIPADLCVLEVGLGGRLDATNVIDKPAAVGITSVSMDHENFLGNTLGAIAGEKAGIMKAGAPTVIGPQTGEAMGVIRARAADLGLKPQVFDEDWHVLPHLKGGSFRYTHGRCELELPAPSLAGEHQMINAGMAIALARAQKAITIPDAAIRAGLGWVRWPARLQELSGTQLNALLPDGASLYLDGGHNPAAGQVIRSFLTGIDPVERAITLVIGMLNRKDAKGYLKPLAGIVNHVIAVPIECDEDPAEPGFLAAAATDVGINGIVAKDVPSALKMITERAHPERPPFVLIGGSLYLAGNVLRMTGELPA